jgi:outer membrane protein
MKSMHKFIATALFLLASPVLTCASSLTLDQCIEHGLAFNPQITAYRLSIEEAEEGIYEAWGSFLPTLSADYNYNQLTNSGSANLDRDYLSSDSQSFQIRLSQPLFTGMAGMAGLKKARESQTYREYELRLVQQQLIREIRISFNDILLQEQLIEKWTESIERLENQQEIAKAWVAQDLAPRLRLLEIVVELSNARQSLVSAEAALAIAEAKLKQWLALNPEEPFSIEGSLQQSVSANCDVVGSCLEWALHQRPELKLTDLNVAMAHEDAKLIRARNLPQASFAASWNDYEREFDDSRLDKEIRDYYTLSLNLSVKPFQGGKNIFAYRKQLLTIKRLQQERIKQKSSIVTEVKTRFELFLSGISLLDASKKGVEEANEAYNFAARSAKLGVLSLKDLLNAELRLTQTEISKINAEHALQVSQVHLNYAMGDAASQL